MMNVWGRRRKNGNADTGEVRASGERSVAVGRDIGVVITGDHVTLHQVPQLQGAAADLQRLAIERQRLRMETFRQALRHAEATFRLSVAFMAGGAGILLAGGVLALIHAGNPDLSYVPLITSLTGLLITGGGGALAIHANRARRHLTEQGERLDAQIAEDHKVERLRGWIDRVVSPETRDQLNTTAAIKDMGLDPDPAAITDRVLPEVERVSGEIGASRPDPAGPGRPG
ncbi:hypothetical protein MRQ86_10160 [Streptomyces sp. MMS21 TC-5]|uniref:TRADD-N-associated membrane domain-containing protein n=1 Tax=Streptomyces TaxID=1883 RepID=UPI0006AE4095|nr:MULTISPECIES: hypothetical protein [unclassified Streptomyces]MCI4080695.1 hypothetical protein [Streptomyces sp. MMS21 TC-5]RSS99267.1 hypothetical protein EF904_25530 [Streptomyces sp. WAC05950]